MPRPDPTLHLRLDRSDLALLDRLAGGVAASVPGSRPPGRAEMLRILLRRARGEEDASAAGEVGVGREPVFVGESLVGRGDEPLPDVPGGAGARLRGILGVSSDAYRGIRRRNLCRRGWDPRKASGAAVDLVEEVAGQPDGAVLLVLLGRRVASAFGLARELRPFSAVDGCVLGPALGPAASGARLASLPHPSGRCREWNRPESVREARALLRRECPEWVDRFKVPA